MDWGESRLWIGGSWREDVRWEVEEAQAEEWSLEKWRLEERGREEERSMKGGGMERLWREQARHMTEMRRKEEEEEKRRKEEERDQTALEPNRLPVRLHRPRGLVHPHPHELLPLRPMRVVSAMHTNKPEGESL